MIYQPYLTDGRWRGFADFLEKQPGGGYEPVDTKLARTAKPSHVLQLCFYAEQLARIQGSPVEHIHVDVQPLTVALADAARKVQVHDALASMSAAVLDYRGLTAVRGRLLQWLAGPAG